MYLVFEGVVCFLSGRVLEGVVSVVFKVMFLVFKVFLKGVVFVAVEGVLL